MSYRRKSAYRRKLIIVVMILVSGVLVACGDDGPQEAETQPTMADPIKVRVGWQPAVDEMFFAAQQYDLWTAEGLDVEYVQFQAGPAMMAALKAGDIDVAALSSGPTISAVAAGIDIKTFAIRARAGDTAGLLLPKDSPINSFQDLKGKTVGGFQGTGAYSGFLTKLQAEGMSPEDVDLINVDIAGQGPAFRNGDVDALVAYPPTSLVLANDLGAYMLSTLTDWGIPLPSLWVARTSFMDDTPEAITKFVAGIDATYPIIAKADPESFEYIAETLNIEPELVALTHELTTIPTLDQQASPDHDLSLTGGGLLSVMEEQAASMVSIDQLEEAPDLTGVIDSRHLEAYLNDKGRG